MFIWTVRHPTKWFLYHISLIEWLAHGLANLNAILHDPPVICLLSNLETRENPSQTHTQVRIESLVGCESTTLAMANPTNLPSSSSAKVRGVLSLVVPPLGQVSLSPPLLGARSLGPNRRTLCQTRETGPILVLSSRYVSLDPSVYLIKKNKHREN